MELATNTTSPTATDDTTPSTRLDDAPLACGIGLGLGLGLVLGVGAVEPAREPTTGGTAGEETGLRLGAPPPPLPLTAGGIPGAAAGEPYSAEGALTRTIIRCPASQWPAAPLTK